MLKAKLLFSLLKAATTESGVGLMAPPRGKLVILSKIRGKILSEAGRCFGCLELLEVSWKRHSGGCSCACPTTELYQTFVKSRLETACVAVFMCMCSDDCRFQGFCKQLEESIMVLGVSKRLAVFIRCFLELNLKYRIMTSSVLDFK
ncbi:hypothetical protein BaRGS_00001102 [Batillaria attramentaria]|uniref:Uncharacterized protein n=1 Tax=Batillaria attramentaria TaxID=370345 RepID=A0ABD0M680_9CAEN